MLNFFSKPTGKKALDIFYNEFKKYNDIPYNSFVEEVTSRKGDLVGSLDLGIDVAELSDSVVEKAMKKLAMQSHGTVPSNAAFNTALAQKDAEFDFQDAINVTTETIQDTTKIVKDTFDKLMLFKILGVIGAGLLFANTLLKKRKK